MALIACKECGAKVSTKARACPKCGAKVPKTKWWLWVPLGLVVAFFGIGFVASRSPEAQADAKAGRAIDFCWEEQKRKSFSAGAQRFVAGTCEKMETEYTQKYGHRP